MQPYLEHSNNANMEEKKVSTYVFDLIKALIKEILVVLYNFNTNINTCVQIMSLYSFPKCSRSQIIHGDIIAAGYYKI
jgi:hypothetical protein